MADESFRVRENTELYLGTGRERTSLWLIRQGVDLIRQLKFSFMHPRLVWDEILCECIYPACIARKKGLHMEGRVIVRGFPLIDISRGASITIGKDVTLNSRNRGYHINLHSPVKLFADRPGAEISIGKNTRIHGTCIHAHRRISIGQGCLIAANTQIFDSSGHDLSFSQVENRIHTTGSPRPIVIEDNVWIGANCIILPGTHIGCGSVIAAGSVVMKSVPSLVIAGGNPARVVRDYSS
ncbi:MAG: acyltransferase [bacterium]